MNKFLDSTGLQTLWTKIKNTFVKKEEGKGLFSGKYTDLTDEPTFSGNPAYTIGGLSSSDSIEGKTAKEVVDMIVNAEFAPKWTDATSSISTATTTFSVGDAVPATSAFTLGGSTASAVGKTTATGGALNTTSSALSVQTSGVAFGDTITSRKQIVVQYSRVYSAGTTQVVSSKGTATNKTASNATTKLSDASVNSNIDASTFNIKAITVATKTVTLNYALPIYIDGTAQTLGYTTNSYQKSKAIAEGGNINFSVPASYTSVKIYYYDSVTQKWVDITSSCTTATADKELGAGKTKVSYKTYTFSEVAGERPYKVEFTIA